MPGDYKKNSLTLPSAVALGTGVMIGAGIFALTGQVAELAGGLFPIAFLVGAIITGFSAYSYVKLANAFPSAGGIGMFLEKAYGKEMTTSVNALLMALSMIINESLVARTFGTYALQPFDVSNKGFLVPALGVGLLIFAFVMNMVSNKIVGWFAITMAAVKTVGILIFAGAGLWVAESFFGTISNGLGEQGSAAGFVASLALTILAYKGFTTITNSGSEIVEPHKNVGRAIMWAIGICFVVYMLVTLAVGGNLSAQEIIDAKDYALAEATRPALGQYGLWFTVVIAGIATASGIIASVFAVSRMLSMVMEMRMIPCLALPMGGRLQKHVAVYIVGIAILLTIFFDLSRIASLGAILYIIMDIAIHWGVLRHLRSEVDAKPAILVTAIALDAVVLGAFIWIKAQTDRVVLGVAAATLVVLVVGQWLYFRYRKPEPDEG